MRTIINEQKIAHLRAKSVKPKEEKHAKKSAPVRISTKGY
jgi:hypothetical protein